MQYFTTTSEWQPDDLLPCRCPGLHLVLFIRSSDPSSVQARAYLGAAAGLPPVREVDLDSPDPTQQQVVDWFGVSETPALAVIADGALLALETECTEGACQRAIQTARDCAEQLDLGD